MGFFTTLTKAFDKIDDIVFRPIDAISNWVEEPLKKWDHQRELETLREKGRLDAMQQSRLQSLEEEKHRFELERQERMKRLEVEATNALRQAEVQLEELKKNEELRRKKEAAEAMVSYQKKLMRLNKDIIEALGNMRLDLQERALNLIEERTARYKNMQQLERQQAMQELKQIRADFSDDEAIRDQLGDIVLGNLRNMLASADRFIDNLSVILSELNEDIKLLTEHGRHLIDKQADRLGVVGPAPTVTSIAERQVGTTDAPRALTSGR